MKVVTIGSAMIDAIAIIDDSLIERMSMRNSDVSYLLLESGRKVEAKQISNHCGGGAVNTAVGVARLGFESACIVKIGADRRAETVRSLLEAERVSQQWVTTAPDEATGASILIAAHDRDVSIFTYRGANTRLSADDITAEALTADLVYIAPLSNEAADAFPHIVKLARKTDATVAANPGVRQLTRRASDFFASLDKIDILSMNRAEAETLIPRIVDRIGEGGPPLLAPDGSDGPRLGKIGFSAGGYDLSLAKFMAGMRDFGVRYCLVTDGKRGAYASDGAKIFFQPSLPATVAGTVGAGDAFASTFAAWLNYTADPRAALKAAALNAASVVSHIDAQSGLLDRATIEAGLTTPTPDELAPLSWPMEL
ncbi:MAG: carbohydrate kinase family protein [Neomegalonema sp.]|nr:carbohydrate kinase family protein [Neomegalonema sp.]